MITVRYTFWELFITLVGGLLLALLFNRMTRTFAAMRAIVFMPRYIAVATSAVVFIWILHGNYGILNYVLSSSVSRVPTGWCRPTPPWRAS